MSDDRQGDGAALRGGHASGARHWIGFLVSGGLAFLVDAGVLEAGVRLFALDPLLARVAAIWAAMVVGWLAHRRLTFAVEAPISLTEFLRYVAAGWSAAAVNYAAFAAFIIALPQLPRLVCLFLASGIAMVFAYAAMRYAVFQRPPGETE